MGNSVATMQASYNPSRRKRSAQATVDAHAAYTARRIRTVADA
jgi:hypothetical protein